MNTAIFDFINEKSSSFVIIHTKLTIQDFDVLFRKSIADFISSVEESRNAYTEIEEKMKSVNSEDKEYNALSNKHVELYFKYLDLTKDNSFFEHLEQRIGYAAFMDYKMVIKDFKIVDIQDWLLSKQKNMM